MNSEINVQYLELQLETTTTTNNKVKWKTPYKKDTGAHGKPLRDTKIPFGGCSLKLFSSLRGDSATVKQQIISCHMLFQLNTLKGPAKAPAVELLRLNTPGSTKNTFFIP